MKLDGLVKVWMKRGTAALFILLLIYEKNLPLIFWDNVFLAGLLLFMLGGAALLLEKGVFKRFFNGCQKLLKSTSRIEAYALEMEERHLSSQTVGVNKPVAPFLLISGILLIVPSALFSLIMF